LQKAWGVTKVEQARSVAGVALETNVEVLLGFFEVCLRLDMLRG
jgi:hypothetical protein